MHLAIDSSQLHERRSSVRSSFIPRRTFRAECRALGEQTRSNVCRGRKGEKNEIVALSTRFRLNSSERMPFLAHLEGMLVLIRAGSSVSYRNLVSTRSLTVGISLTEKSPSAYNVVHSVNRTSPAGPRFPRTPSGPRTMTLTRSRCNLADVAIHWYWDDCTANSTLTLGYPQDTILHNCFLSYAW